MPTICCVPNCRTYGGHLFPKDPVLKEKWEQAIGRPATKLSKICRSHFRDEDYVGESVGPSKVRQRLKKDAIPTVFPWNCKKWKSLRDFKNDNNNFVVKESKTNIAVRKQTSEAKPVPKLPQTPVAIPVPKLPETPEAKPVPELPGPSTETLAFSCVEAIYDYNNDVNDSDSSYEGNDDTTMDDDDTDDDDAVETMIPIHAASYTLPTGLQNTVNRLIKGTVPSMFAWNSDSSSASNKDSANNEDQWYNNVCIRRNGNRKSNIVNGEWNSASIKSEENGVIASMNGEGSWINEVCIKRKSKALSSLDTNNSTDSMTKMDPQIFALSCVEAIYNEDDVPADEKEQCPQKIATNIKQELEGEANNCITEIVNSYRCTLCYYCTENKQEFKRHTDKHKNINIVNESDTTVRSLGCIRCAHCNYIAKTAMALKNHCKMHLNSKFRCSSCTFAGISLQDLVAHHKDSHLPHQTVKKLYRKPQNNVNGNG